MHNAWEVIEDNCEKLHELWSSYNGVTTYEDVLHKMPLLKVTIKNYAAMRKIFVIKIVLKKTSMIFIALSTHVTCLTSALIALLTDASD